MKPHQPSSHLTGPTIGVFDSGFGGLTVLRELLQVLPNARFIYLGDTARLPYGAKSPATVARYATSSAKFLIEEGAQLLVIACNTASALALDNIREAAAPIAVIGVIEPGAQAAQLVHPGRDVLVLATAATVASGAYTRALLAAGHRHATEKACPLLVPLVEEGWINHPVTTEVARIYLTEALAQAPTAETLLLGCTHYPLLKPLLERTLQSLGRPLTLVDSAHATARATAAHLALSDLKSGAVSGKEATLTVYATDSTDKFRALGSAFLGRPLPEVHLLDLGG